jgi:hypothetical protein
MLISKENRRAIYESLFKGERAGLFPGRPSCLDEGADMLLRRIACFGSTEIEGVMVAEKDFNAPSHPDLPQVRNLEVIKAMQSLTSKGYVKTQFSWQWYYYTLTPEGLDYLREVSRRMRRVWSRLGLGGS